MDVVLQALLVLFVIGVANLAPVVFRHIPLLGSPVDKGITWRGRDLFGPSKTWRGLLVATIAGGLIFIWEQQFATDWAAFEEFSTLPAYTGFALGLGAILGDLVKSFFKRQRDVQSGETWFPFDQVDYVLGGLVALSFFALPSGKLVLTTLILGFMFHILVNVLGYILKIRDRWI